mmetsp:Transcript_24122/g.36663  ORF Transcript_24122/g.36663 Transcript_24122/m.36663 type:complete len:213 (-) Transcript_24122:366-1004(-)
MQRKKVISRASLSVKQIPFQQIIHIRNLPITNLSPLITIIIISIIVIPTLLLRHDFKPYNMNYLLSPSPLAIIIIIFHTHNQPPARPIPHLKEFQTRNRRLGDHRPLVPRIVIVLCEIRQHVEIAFVESVLLVRTVQPVDGTSHVRIILDDLSREAGYRYGEEVLQAGCDGFEGEFEVYVGGVYERLVFAEELFVHHSEEVLVVVVFVGRGG